ncbi:MAG: hypothetical protein H7196_00695 [candidate division SR1 bacterium]|nr:hypothetical protein [candidate division SR1 bacterium]
MGFKYKYIVDYKGQTYTGLLDQEDHFCWLDDSYTYWGIMVPTICKDENDQTI